MVQLSNDDWNNLFRNAWDELYDALSPCIVSLSWCDKLIVPKDDSNVFVAYDPQKRFASGCLLDVNGVWMFLTAGHVLHQIRCADKVGRTTFRFGITDGFHKPGSMLETVPFPFEYDKCLAIDNCDGVDYGLVPIPRIVREALVNNGVRAVPIEMLASPNEGFDGYALIGIPHEQVRLASVVDVPGKRFGTCYVGFPMIPVERAEMVPDEVDTTSSPFVGHIVSLLGHYEPNEVFELESICGMSGGPIFGIRIDDGSLQVRLVAVQSGWFEQRRIIVGSRVLALVEQLLNQEAELRRNTASGQEKPRQAPIPEVASTPTP